MMSTESMDTSSRFSFSKKRTRPSVIGSSAPEKRAAGAAGAAGDSPSLALPGQKGNDEVLFPKRVGRQNERFGNDVLHGPIMMKAGPGRGVRIK